MCFKVDCKQCGKITWGGCGNHVPSVYNGIEKGKHCTCRPWPGVALPSDTSSSKTSTTSTTSTSTSRYI
ncbi:hypothetical protein J5N97_028506 [Dioscorea zingiberensis]|uniref:Uncharacterized protein n=1 Tax=Dioscorea zingiberensis TaxID=325984 RepID=A0A9D5BZL4_9LILI|nr:hypothetical protein J5N97_028506 [Dioscorea zingiberensis]